MKDERAVTTKGAATKQRAVVVDGANKRERAASNESAETEVRAGRSESAEHVERAEDVKSADNDERATEPESARTAERADKSEGAEPTELPIHRLGYPKIGTAIHHLWEAQQAGWPDHLPHEAWRELVLVKNQEKEGATSSANLPAFQPDYAPNYLATENEPVPEMKPVMAPKVRR